MVNNAAMTALLLAARSGQTESVQLLMATGRADVGHRDSDGYTALHHAVMAGDRDCVEALLTKSTVQSGTMDVAANDGSTALSIAHNEGQQEIEDLLLARGAKPLTQGEGSEASDQTNMGETEARDDSDDNEF